MPLYDFEDVEKGELVEHYFAMADRPPTGKVVEIGGRKVSRVITPTQLAPVRSYEFVSNALPRENVADPKWPCDERGRPRFKSKKEVEEYTARSEGKAAWDQFEDPD